MSQVAQLGLLHRAVAKTVVSCVRVVSFRVVRARGVYFYWDQAGKFSACSFPVTTVPFSLAAYSLSP